MILRLSDILDLPLLREMLDSLRLAAGIPLGLLNADGEVLIATGWQPLCTDYHLKHPELRSRCLLNCLPAPVPGEHSPREVVCASGLIDIVLPICCEESCLGYLFVGQFLTAPADPEQGRRFAVRNGVDPDDYLRHLAAVPVIPRAQVERWLGFFATLIRQLSATGLARLREEQARLALADSRQALQESEARFRSIVEGTPLGIHMYRSEPDGRLIFTGYNPAANTVLGIDNRQFLGMDLLEAFPDLANTDVPERYREVCASGRPWRVEQLVYADGKVAGAYEVYAFRTGENRMASVFMDIGDRLRAERLKDEFISTAAHELRTPITSVLGYSEIMLEQLEQLPPEQLREYLTVVYSRAEALAQIVGEMLDLSRMQSGQVIPLSRQLGDYSALVREVVSHYRQVNDGHVFRLELVESLPLVEFDAAKLHQVFDNLISNAFKFSPRGSEIVIDVSLQGSEVLTAVSDQGIGMTPEQVARIFDKFYRADASSTAAASGLGLGMSLVKGIVERHDGQIWVESAPGRGTTVRFTLPLAVVPGS